MTARPKAASLLGQLFGQPHAAGEYSIGALSALCAHLSKTVLVTERNRDAVVEQLRQLTEQLVWGDRHDPAFFEYFLEKKVLSVFWRFLAQPRSPVAVQVQLLQTLAILLQNIAAGPSVFFILSNNHINELITHPFDFEHEELLTHYVSLLKTVQFFISSTKEGTQERARAVPLPSILRWAAVGQCTLLCLWTMSTLDEMMTRASSHQNLLFRVVALQTPVLTIDTRLQPPLQFALFDEALKLWNHEERMVRTAVRTIVLSVCQVDDQHVRSYVSASTSLLRQLSIALTTHFENVLRRLAMGAILSDLECALQQLLDEMYFLNDMLAAGSSSMLSRRLVGALLSGFVLPLLVGQLIELPSKLQAQLTSVVDSALEGAGDATTCRPLAFYLLAHCISLFTHPPLIAALAVLLLHPKLNMESVRLPNSIASPPVSSPLEGSPQARSCTPAPTPASPYDRVPISPTSGFFIRSSSSPHNLLPILSHACTTTSFHGEPHDSSDVQQSPASKGSSGRLSTGRASSESKMESSCPRDADCSCYLPLNDTGPDCNALRAALLDALTDRDERVALSASCVLLAALRSPSIHSEVLRQAKLMPLRELRAESLLSHLLRTSQSKHADEHIEESREVQYCVPVVTSLLANLCSGPSLLVEPRAPIPHQDSYTTPPSTPVARTMKLPSGPSGLTSLSNIQLPDQSQPSPNLSLPVSPRAATPATNCAPRSPSSTPNNVGVISRETSKIGRLLSIQISAELLVDLVHDTSSTPTLGSAHVGALLRAHENAAIRLRAALEGRYAVSLSNLVDYEGRQLPLPINLTLRASQLLADCSLLLPADQLPKSIHLSRRSPRDDLEATRVTIQRCATAQAFLLIRHTRNLLLRLPDDVRAMARPQATLPKRGDLLPTSTSTQLLSCIVLHPILSAQTSNAVDCEKFHGLLAVFDASSVAQSTELTREARQRAMDVDVAEAARREHLFLVRPVIEPDPSEPSEMVGNIFKAVNRDGADGADLLQINQKEVEEEVPCTIEEKAGRESVSCLQDSNSRSSGCPKAQPQLQVVLTIPLSAMTIRVDDNTGTQLLLSVPRHHAPPGVNAEHPIRIDFGEQRRCSSAKHQLEQACLSARAQQHQRLVAMLGNQPASPKRSTSDDGSSRLAVESL